MIAKKARTTAAGVLGEVRRARSFDPCQQSAISNDKQRRAAFFSLDPQDWSHCCARLAVRDKTTASSIGDSNRVRYSSSM